MVNAERAAARQTWRLELDGIGSTYEENHTRLIALSGLSLRVGAGEFVAIVGPAGSGKSTLLDLVAGLIEPDDGIVRLNGEATTTAERRSSTPTRSCSPPRLAIPISRWIPKWRETGTSTPSVR